MVGNALGFILGIGNRIRLSSECNVKQYFLIECPPCTGGFTKYERVGLWPEGLTFLKFNTRAKTEEKERSRGREEEQAVVSAVFLKAWL